jgi:hypothetical protein
MEALNELVQDTMDLDEDGIDDSDVDKLILGMESDVQRKKAELEQEEEEDPI